MTNTLLLWLSGGLCAIGTASLSAALMIFRRRPGSTVLSTLIESKSPLPCRGPIARLDFSQSLDPRLFAQAAEDEVLSYATLHLRHLVPNGVPMTLQALRQWLARSELVVEASDKAKAAVQSGTAAIQRHRRTARLLPHVVDRKSGQTIDVMKELGPGRKAVTGAATASTIIVSVAHMIATADLARTLRLVDQKIDLLLAYRRIDQQAKLERIYTAAKELLTAGLDEARRMELWRLRGELRELRAIWRGELERHLVQIENPAEEAWIRRMFTRQSSYDQRITGKISGGMLRLAMYEYALRIDWVLAVASDTWIEATGIFADELTAMGQVRKLLKEKASFISQNQRGFAQPMIDGLEAMITEYQQLVPGRPEQSVSVPSQPLPLT